MNEPDRDSGLDRLFDGFEAEMMRRVVVPGADAARRAAYFRGRRNSRVATAVTAVAAMSVGSGVTWAVTGGGGRGPEPVPTVSPSVVAPATPTPDSSPSPSIPPSSEPSAPPSPSADPTITAGPKRAVNLSVTGPAEIRLTTAPGGGFHGKVTFTVRNDGPTAVTLLTATYDLGPSLDFESGVPSNGVNTCVYHGAPTVLRCSPDGRLAAGSSLDFDLNMWSGVAATGSDQVFTLKITAMANNAGIFSDLEEMSPGNNTVTVRVIVPRA
jgi:hypothetical protein